jgi:hypothetical protein
MRIGLISPAKNATRQTMFLSRNCFSGTILSTIQVGRHSSYSHCSSSSCASCSRSFSFLFFLFSFVFFSSLVLSLLSFISILPQLSPFLLRTSFLSGKQPLTPLLWISAALLRSPDARASFSRLVKHYCHKSCVTETSPFQRLELTRDSSAAAEHLVKPYPWEVEFDQLQLGKWISLTMRRESEE